MALFFAAAYLTILVPPLLLLSLLVEGPQAMAAGLHKADLGTWAAVLLVLIARGPGMLSVDHWLASRRAAIR